MNNITLTKKIDVIGEFDVAVCGGGPSGFIAAISAARRGAKVALVERYGFLGGMATSALVNPISRFCKNRETVIKGLPLEFLSRLEEIGGAMLDIESGHAPVDSEKYKLIAQRMVAEAGVTLYLHSLISDVITENGTVTHVVLENKSGSCALKAKYFIDCTGDADVAYRAGVPMLEQPPANELQPASICLRLGGVKLDPEKRIHPHVFEGVHVRKTMLALAERENLPEFGGPWFCTVMNDSGNICSVNITRTAVDATDFKSLTDAELKLRENVHFFVKLLKEEIPAFKDAFLITTGTQIGIRESRRIKGHHILTEEEYVNCVDFPDSVARGAHQIDIHKAGGSSQELTSLPTAPHIPYGSQYADGFDNLLVAGRCISTERRPLASLRVQATAMALGESAGLAASLALRDGVSVAEINTSELRQILEDNGAVT